MGETRRLAAVVAIDVVGFSRLMGEDEAGTARAVREHRDAAQPLVAARGGRIVKTMGDGLLLEFPSAVASVECAIAIQALMVERNAETPQARRVLYRIGVNLGDVLLEGEDILGEGVNIAARLESICDPGGVLISAAVHDHVRGRIDAEFVDLGEKPLKNIARPVRAYAVKLAPADPAPARSHASPTPADSRRSSIVVLPFANFGGEAEYEYFADGVTESLTTDLARMPGGFVIGRNTAFTYKGKAVDIKQVGRELGVRYVLEGSIQRSGSRMRVNVQLVDAESGHHLWAERFDKPLADLFDMQDEIVARVANSLSVQLVGAEARRTERSSNPDSMDLVFQAQAYMNRGFTADNVAKARELSAQAMALDRDNVVALISLASADLVAARIFVPDNRAALFAEVERIVAKALGLAPESAVAFLLLGSLHCATDRASQGIRNLERALELDPGLAAAHGEIGIAKVLLGRAQETEGHILEALRLSPRDNVAHLWCSHAGVAKLVLGEFMEAEAWLRRSIERYFNDPTAHFFLSCALVAMGRLPEARSEASIGLAINPGYNLARVRAGASDNPALAAGVERFIDALRVAGVPEE